MEIRRGSVSNRSTKQFVRSYKEWRSKENEESQVQKLLKILLEHGLRHTVSLSGNFKRIHPDELTPCGDKIPTHVLTAPWTGSRSRSGWMLFETTEDGSLLLRPAGPGATNLVTGIQPLSCWTSIPAIFITANVGEC